MIVYLLLLITEGMGGECGRAKEKFEVRRTGNEDSSSSLSKNAASFDFVLSMAHSQGS